MKLTHHRYFAEASIPTDETFKRNSRTAYENAEHTLCSRSKQDTPWRHGILVFIYTAIKRILSQLTSSDCYIYFASATSFLCLYRSSVCLTAQCKPRA
jgi:hypothetical protein